MLESEPIDILPLNESKSGRANQRFLSSTEADRNVRLQAAYDAILQGRLSQRQASTTYQIPRSTLQRHMSALDREADKVDTMDKDHARIIDAIIFDPHSSASLADVSTHQSLHNRSEVNNHGATYLHTGDFPLNLYPQNNNTCLDCQCTHCINRTAEYMPNSTSHYQDFPSVYPNSLPPHFHNNHSNHTELRPTPPCSFVLSHQLLNRLEVALNFNPDHRKHRTGELREQCHEYQDILRALLDEVRADDRGVPDRRRGYAM